MPRKNRKRKIFMDLKIKDVKQQKKPKVGQWKDDPYQRLPRNRMENDVKQKKIIDLEAIKSTGNLRWSEKMIPIRV